MRLWLSVGLVCVDLVIHVKGISFHVFIHFFMVGLVLIPLAPPYTHTHKRTRTQAVLKDSSSARLSNLFSMNAKECETIEMCAQWVTNEDVRAMLVPNSDFVTFQLSSALTGAGCGSQYRVVGDPMLADDRYTAHPH